MDLTDEMLELNNNILTKEILEVYVKEYIESETTNNKTDEEFVKQYGNVTFVNTIREGIKCYFTKKQLENFNETEESEEFSIVKTAENLGYQVEWSNPSNDYVICLD
jgi:hypothetical protein